MCFKLIRNAGVILALSLLVAIGHSVNVEAEQGEPGLRTWADNSGQYRVLAAFVEFRDGKVHLEKQDGNVVAVPIERLSPGDQEYVKQRMASDPFAGGESEIERSTRELCSQIVNSYRVQKLGAKPRIAVVEFSDLGFQVTNLGRLLSEELITKLFSTGEYNVVERSLLVKTMAEHNLAYKGFVDPGTAKELGRILSADAIVSGTIADLGASLKVNARLISTETGEISAVADLRIRKTPEVAKLLGIIGKPGRDSLREEADDHILWKEDFSTYKEGDASDWGPNVFVEKGMDGRKWIATSLDGTWTVGPNVVLPEDFYLEFAFSAQVATLRDHQGYTVPYYDDAKGAVKTALHLVDKEGSKYEIVWHIDGKTHTFELPDGSNSKITDGNARPMMHPTQEGAGHGPRMRAYGRPPVTMRQAARTPRGRFLERSEEDPDIWWTAGTVRIEKTRRVIKVWVDDNLALSGNVGGFAEFRRFQVEVYKRGAKVHDRFGDYDPRAEWVFFTSFKVGRL